MLEANQDPKVAKMTLQAPGPLSWPPAKSLISFWENDTKDKQIVLTGNSLLWIMTTFAFIFELVWILFHAVRERRSPVDRTESILMSLPPVVRYVYDYRPAAGSPEAELTDYWLKPQDWAN